jgi:hypothetical protein
MQTEDAEGLSGQGLALQGLVQGHGGEGYQRCANPETGSYDNFKVSLSIKSLT